ncbi:MAG: hypothetical protein IJ068_00775 [Bacilli bacterium]|nr:hypothetical protein [Bacilli bacterium]
MLNLKKMRDNDNLVISLNKTNIKYYIKNTRKIKKYCDNRNLNLKLFYDNKLVSEINNEDADLKDMTTIMKAINIKDKSERFNYIYDMICSVLDLKIKEENYCEFKDNICIRDRENQCDHRNGCCECNGRGLCQYLVNGKCQINCISCKLFTCKFLENRGIKQNINDHVLVKYFFSHKQIDILKYSFWTPKEVIIERLLKNKYVRP